MKTKKIFLIVTIILFNFCVFSQNNISQNEAGLDGKITSFYNKYKINNHCYTGKQENINEVENYKDFATAAVIDKHGNIYVTGYSASGYPQQTISDYLTIKYSSTGEQLWISRYDGGGRDYSYAIVLDDSSNAYVTGYSDGIQTDYATIKYDSSGNQVWVSRYNNTEANLDDGGTAIALDLSGNVYVTGFSYGLNTSVDYATIKYDNNGHQLWCSRYNGPVNLFEHAWDIAVDKEGNAYVTGHRVGDNSMFDYATIKYDKSGNELWIRIFDGPLNNYDYAKALALDDSGNVYVTGYSTGINSSEDYATIKYDSKGNEKWIARYSVGIDLAQEIAVDKNGNVFVTGSSIGEGTMEDYATIKYNPSGEEVWVKRYNGPKNDLDVAESLTIDSSGNIYITGWSSGPGINNYDYATIKYNTSGDQLWIARYDGPAQRKDGASTVIVDKQGNAVVTGFSTGSSLDEDIATIKYSPDGQVLWMNRFGGPYVPVDLINFTAYLNNGNNVILNWTTASELNNKGFDIEREMFPGIFEKIGFIKGMGTTSEYNSYQYTDKNVLPGPYTYRLKQIDFSGEYKYSKNLDIVVNYVPDKFEISQNYPNPFNPTSRVKVNIPYSSNISLDIYSVLGEKIKNFFSGTLTAGVHIFGIDASDYPGGVYFYKLSVFNNSGEDFVIVKKMIVQK